MSRTTLIVTEVLDCLSLPAGEGDNHEPACTRHGNRYWQLADESGPWTCPVCHPPARSDIHWRGEPS